MTAQPTPSSGDELPSYVVRRAGLGPLVMAWCIIRYRHRYSRATYWAGGWHICPTERRGRS